MPGTKSSGGSDCIDSAWKAVRHRTCLNQPLIALVTISATDPVAILIHCNYSCPFVQFVG